MKTYKPKYRRHPTYYKTICPDCDLILTVRWAYFGALPTRIHRTRQNVCLFCQDTVIQTVKINQSEYMWVCKSILTFLTRSRNFLKKSDFYQK